MRMRAVALRQLLTVARGAVIGVVEIIPGVSGGTVALILGVYERLIIGAGELVRGLVHAVVGPLRGRGLARARAHLRAVPWSFLVPLGVGMLGAVLLAARVVEPLVESHPVESRALFAGLIVVSLIVPARMVGDRWRARDVLLALAAAALAFVLTALPTAGEADASPLVIVLSAAVAICALVLPGVSGSFVLVGLGMYEPTIRAVSALDVGYLALFALGALIGLGSFVHVLRWLLLHRHRVTLAIMTGLMAGSLRALWPWQDDARELLPPTGDVLGPVLWFALGALLVGGMLLGERALTRSRASAVPESG